MRHTLQPHPNLVTRSRQRSGTGCSTRRLVRCMCSRDTRSARPRPLRLGSTIQRDMALQTLTRSQPCRCSRRSSWCCTVTPSCRPQSWQQCDRRVTVTSHSCQASTPSIEQSGVNSTTSHYTTAERSTKGTTRRRSFGSAASKSNVSCLGVTEIQLKNSSTFVRILQ